MLLVPCLNAYQTGISCEQIYRSLRFFILQLETESKELYFSFSNLTYTKHTLNLNFPSFICNPSKINATKCHSVKQRNKPGFP